MDIGDIGIWTSYRPFGIERAGEAAKLVEQLGYGAWWVGGSPHVPDIRPILEATSTLVAATGILNVWSNDPNETAEADAALRADSPGRFMLGVGIGHPEATSDYRRPLKTMREFLDGLDASLDDVRRGSPQLAPGTRSTVAGTAVVSARRLVFRLRASVRPRPLRRPRLPHRPASSRAARLAAAVRGRRSPRRARAAA
jgi:alkanesulfonate monooxygenase SsuD/methylene tetrahydromethanopterin reductase-like flavin-dependent oxidoreductase (luciferase family)